MQVSKVLHLTFQLTEAESFLLPLPHGSDHVRVTLVKVEYSAGSRSITASGKLIDGAWAGSEHTLTLDSLAQLPRELSEIILSPTRTG